MLFFTFLLPSYLTYFLSFFSFLLSPFPPAEDLESLKLAFHGVDAVFAMTVPNRKSTDPENEFNQVKNIADAAKESGSFLVFSTLDDISGKSKGKYVNVKAFDQKYKGEQYIRDLGIPAAFVKPGGFAETGHPTRPDPNGPFVVSVCELPVDFVSV